MDGRDPSFDAVRKVVVAEHLAKVREAACATKDAFLLAAMKAMALAGNGHTRIIQNEAIHVLPARIVARGEGWWLCGPGGGWLAALDGVPVDEVFERLRPCLAGTQARQRAIAGPVLVWPAALREAGIAKNAAVTLQGDAWEKQLPLAERVAATGLYPLPERGGDRPGEGMPPLDGAEALHCVLPGFAELDMPDLDARIAEAVRQVAGAKDAVVIDLRGNPGGSFLRVLPLLETLREAWRGTRCAVVVDRYTFSAGIVFAALLVAHLGPRVQVFGEKMGDGLTFWAEGGTIPLPQSGAALRWSNGYHDWASGDPGRQGPEDLRPYMTAVGQLAIHPQAELRGWLAGG